MTFDQIDIFDKADKFGIDLSKHRCSCEVCSKTSQWCPASLSSLAMEIAENEAIALHLIEQIK